MLLLLLLLLLLPLLLFKLLLFAPSCGVWPMWGAVWLAETVAGTDKEGADMPAGAEEETGTEAETGALRA